MAFVVDRGRMVGRFGCGVEPFAVGRCEAVDGHAKLQAVVGVDAVVVGFGGGGEGVGNRVTS